MNPLNVRLLAPAIFATTIALAIHCQAMTCSDLVCTLDASEVGLDNDVLNKKVTQQILSGPEAAFLAKKYGTRSFDLIRKSKFKIVLVPTVNGKPLVNFTPSPAALASNSPSATDVSCLLGCGVFIVIGGVVCFVLVNANAAKQKKLKQEQDLRRAAADAEQKQREDSDRARHAQAEAKHQEGMLYLTAHSFNWKGIELLMEAATLDPNFIAPRMEIAERLYKIDPAKHAELIVTNAAGAFFCDMDERRTMLFLAEVLEIPECRYHFLRLSLGSIEADEIDDFIRGLHEDTL